MDHDGVVGGEIIAVAIIIDVAIVAHRPCGDLATFSASGKHGEVDILHLLRQLRQREVGHRTLLG